MIILASRTTRITRNEAIDAFIGFEMDVYREDEEALFDIVKNGFPGLKALSNDELLDRIRVFEDESAPFEIVEVLK